MSYGTNLPDQFRRASDHVDKNLRGAKPGDIRYRVRLRAIDIVPFFVAGDRQDFRLARRNPEHESELRAAVGRRLRELVGEGASPVDVETVPGSTEIGYVVRGNLAQLVARTAIEVDFGAGYKKRYWVEADLPG